MTAVVVVEEPSGFVVVEEPGGLVEVADTAPVVVEVAAQGPTGPPGATGPQGPQGPPGASASYVHQQMTPSAVWVIDHTLGYAPGGVTCTDSANGEIVGDITYPSAGRVVVTFAASTGGTAYLS